MSYYIGNAIYDELLANSVQHFRFVTGNAWQLVYGDEDCNPLLLVYARGVKSIDYESPLSAVDKEGMDFLRSLSEVTGLPFIGIKFCTDINEIEEVLLTTNGIAAKRKSLSELKMFFSEHGLPITNSSTVKYLNDKTSSAYHKWQRESLGKSLMVSDIDLYKINTSGLPTTLYELKRSYYPLEKWVPFSDDYNNFKLLYNLCEISNMKLKILYNVRTKSPFFDDPSIIKLFSVNFKSSPPIILDGILSFQDFIRE